MIGYSAVMALLGVAMAVINIVLIRMASRRNTNAAKSI